MLIGRITHLRDDDRFKTIGPDTLVLSAPSALVHLHQAPTGSLKSESEQGEMWFDWAFVDFWKSNYCELTLLIPCESRLKVVFLARRHDPEGNHGGSKFAFIFSRYDIISVHSSFSD